MSDAEYLRNQLLIAMPSMADSNFTKGVTYVCQHNDEGALGLVINHPSGLTLGELLQQLDYDTEDQNVAELPVFIGGPVQNDRGFVLHDPQGKWDSTYSVADHFSVTTSRDILEAIAAGEGPERYLVALGYAGWAPGQLEDEFRQNAWLNTDADADLIYHLPTEQKWTAAASNLGVDINTLSGFVGHA